MSKQKNIKKSDNELLDKKNKDKKPKIYLGYNSRVVLVSFCTLVFFALSVFCVTRSFSIINEQKINYQENSNLDYRVYLKENSFYESDYLDKDMVYVASLIKRIDIDFDYLFKIDKSSYLEFDYDVIGKLVIADNSGKNTFFEKEYTLLNDVKEIMNDEKEYEIKRSISIDYDEYNALANSFKSSYGVETSSRLIIYLRINEHDIENNSFDFDNSNTMSLTIPLSERVINIALDYNNINESNSVISKAQLIIKNNHLIIFSIIFVILTVICLIKLLNLIILLTNKSSKYDRYIKKLLNEYDRLIVETRTAPNTKDKKVVRIDEFQELLDVRDNLKLPVKYYIVTEHQKCNFYIDHDDELYLLVIKAIDFKDKNYEE